MARTLDAAIITQIRAQQLRPVHLVEMYFSSGTVRMTDAGLSVSYGGNTYENLGHLLGLGEITETAEIVVSETTISLSGIDQAYIAIVLGETYIDRRVVIYKGFLDANDTLVAAVAIFDGRMDAPTIEEDPESGSCTVSVRAATYWADFERRPGRHTNHEETQIYFPGDRFFEYVSELNRQIVWGETPRP